MIEPHGINTLIEIALFSFDEFRKKVKDVLSWHETRVLYRAAEASLNDSRLYEARLLTRSNPLLTRALRSAMTQPQAQLFDYQSMFGQRASQFVAPGAVASMFSPGAYLTELYREARALRAPASRYHLDVRRPDLPALVLSQRNLDESLSTLDLSNELLQAGIRAHDPSLADDEAVLQRLATWRTTGATPFHDAFERGRQALLTRDPEGKHVAAAPDVAGLMSTASQLGIRAGIDPELHAILTEAVTDENAEAVYERNFGETPPSELMNVRALARYYDVSDDICTDFIDNYALKGYVKSTKNLNRSQLTYPQLNGAGDLSLLMLDCSLSNGWQGLHYAELEPPPIRYGNVCEFVRFSFASLPSTVDKVKIHQQYKGSSWEHIFTFEQFSASNIDREYRVPVNIDLRQVTKQQPFNLSIDCHDSNGVRLNNPNIRFAPEEQGVPTFLFLLGINKSIRAHKATGLTPAAIDAAAARVDNWAMDETTVCRMLDMQSSMQRYAIDHNQALCLCNGDISRLRFGDEPSPFDRLFNTPPLNGYVFDTGGPRIDLKPGSPDDDPRKAVLKRAFQVDDVSLYRLLTIADPGNPDGTIPNDIAYLSALYRAHLLAAVHRLSVDDLALLLAGLEEGATGLVGIDDETLRGLLGRLQTAVRWLNDMKWRAYDLFVMTTTVYADTLTPEIQTLLDTLNNGLQDPELSDGALIEAMAPYVAASLRLSSNEVAGTVLLWMDQLQPNGMGVDAFWAAVANHTPPPAEAVQFCHAMAQLALVYQATGLDTNSFRWLVEQPDRLVTLPEDETVAGHDARTLMQLTAYAGWVRRLAGNAATVLSAFEADTLTPAQLAQAMALDEELLRQASEQAAQHQQIADKDRLPSWPEIDIVLQWVNLANGLGVAPKGVADWLALDYLRPDAEAPTYAAWDRVATAFTAALRADQADTVAGAQAASLAAALVGYYLKEVADARLTLRSRDELYGYLLIDNQVSAQVETTRIAEAMASVQLYVNRALNRIEPEVDRAVVTRRFFAEWETYNKRYSTWAGVSQLVYYPENYIDPTLRIGQTGMMGDLLQSVSQSYLTADTVGDAFNSYLTAFEQVANLDVISAYHDDLNVEQGLTYFVGCNRNNEVEYYWRSADHDKCHDGQFAANAWSEWRAINCALHPYQGVVRPVVSKSRLHLVWLEQVEQAETKNDRVETTYRYVLKLAYRRYDGNWSAPISYAADALLKNLNLAEHEAPGLYCAESPDDETLLVLCYKIQASPQTTAVAGLFILPDLSSKDMASGQAQLFRETVFPQFDTSDRRRVNNRYGGVQGYEIPASISGNAGFEWGKLSLSRVFGGGIVNISYEASLSSFKVKCSPTVDVRFDVSRDINVMAYLQLHTLQRCSRPGDKVDLYYEYDQRDGNPSDDPKYGPIVNGFLFVSPNFVINAGEEGRIQVSVSGSVHHVTYTGPGTYEVPGMSEPNSYLVGINPPMSSSVLEIRFMHNKTPLDTNIPVDKVIVVVSAGGEPQRFTAQGHVIQMPDPSLSRMVFSFEELTFDASQLVFVNNRASINVTCEAWFADGQLAGKEFFSIPVVKQEQGGTAVLTLLRDENGAQYMQWGPYRVRMNTLFARQLIERAVRGVDAILTMDTQHLSEPPLGHGGYVQVTLPAYNPTAHGSTRGVRLILQSGNAEYSFMNASLTDSEQQTMLFVPVSQVKQGDALDFPANLGAGLGVVLACQAGRFKAGQLQFNQVTFKPVNFAKDAGWTAERDVGMQSSPNYIEPMDFSGANALYFWELFYYSPMLVAQRLLLEQRFDDAQCWLQYVWNPSGYVVRGQLQSYQWNVRPLEEDLGWNAELLDSTDPDAVAQYDPMHYKVATFMRWLDLLLARGDRAYRQLERDTLSEAKMWYLQALHLLGEQPYLPRTAEWSEPPLAVAADETTQRAHLEALEALSAGAQPAPLTANSLTALFLPQANDVLLGYWRTLEQRLYNLRHNLSIDGRPLTLPLYATPANPKELLSAAVASSSGGGKVFPPAEPSLWRFAPMLENAKSTVSQLMQFGSNLQGISERQDGEQLSQLLQTQAKELVLISLDAQDKTLAEVDADIDAVKAAQQGAQQRRAHYDALYEENLNAGEVAAISLQSVAAAELLASTGLHMGAAALDLAPNIFGFSCGGMEYGALMKASAAGMQLQASANMTTASTVSQSEMYRRRREEWDIQKRNAQAELDHIDAQLQALALRKEAANLQKNYLQTQQAQTEAQLAFLKSKFTNEALYSWMRGRLSAIYYQFYDLAVSRCLMAEQAYQWETRSVERFIKPEWNTTYGGLLCGEALMLNLAQMEAAHLIQDARALEVVRTVSLSDFYAGLPDDQQFDLAKKTVAFIEAGGGRAGSDENGLSLENDRLSATVTLRDLKIMEDYPASMQVGSQRRIKQLSVTLPALIGPYQDIQAMLSYGGSLVLPRGCEALAVSRGLDDSGRFELNFNDGKFLPFEGVPVDDGGTLTLRFPNVLGKQEAMLRTLSDIVLHIRYTIR
nr:neuraminidase-like domain-containing protein [Burkholderia sp. GbtcB21]